MRVLLLLFCFGVSSCVTTTIPLGDTNKGIELRLQARLVDMPSIEPAVSSK